MYFGYDYSACRAFLIKILSITGYYDIISAVIVMNINRDETCCFTGHRVIGSNDAQTVRGNLRQAIRMLYREGIRCFISGGAIGFDTEAAAAVVEARRTIPEIRLVLALPCRDQDKLWNASQKAEYSKILAEADEVVYVSEEYTGECMRKRNRFMVDNSCAVLTYIQRPFGGTAYTVNYALDSGRRVINILEVNDET